MLEWLINYGIKRHEEFAFEEIDIHDKLALEAQINQSRRGWHQLIVLMDDIQGKMAELNHKISLHVKDVTQRAKENGDRVNALLDVDDEYIAMDAERKALSAGLSMIQQQMDYYKNDLRALNSSMYNKF